VSVDSRVNQMTACLDEVRTLAANMADEGLISNNLDALRQSANVTLKYAEMLKAELADVKRCASEPLGGGRCQLEVGHVGKHSKTSYPYGIEKGGVTFEWDDESQTRLARKQTSRFD
jgi:hypothetical protein